MHYFASQYYAAHGLLSDRSRMYRREVRQRKARVGAVQAADSDMEVNTDADDLFAEDEDDESASEKEDRCEKSIIEDQERSDGEGSPAKSVPDMYKAFDGSALMAIGTPHLHRKILRLNNVTQVCYSKSMYRRFYQGPTSLRNGKKKWRRQASSRRMKALF